MNFAEALGELLGKANGNSIALFYTLASLLVRGGVCSWPEVADELELHVDWPDGQPNHVIRGMVQNIRNGGRPTLTIVE